MAEPTVAEPTAAEPAWPVEGTVAPPRRPEHVLTLPITRPLARDEIDPVALPVLLLRRLCLPGARGVLRLEGPGILLRLPVEEKSALITKDEAVALRRAFEAPRLRWRLEPFAHDGAPRQARPLSRLALEGVRRMLRQLGVDDLERAFGPRIGEVPVLRADAASLAGDLELEPRELRVLERHLDAATPLKALARRGGLDAAATLQLVALVELYGGLDWREVPSLSDLLADRADRWERASPEEILGVDDDAAEHTLEAAYRSRRRDYAVGSPNDQVCPESCAAIRHRLDEAYAVLRAAIDRHETPPETVRSSSPGRSSKP